VEAFLSAQFVQLLIQIEAALVQKTMGSDPAVMFGFQPDGTVGLAMLHSDRQGSGDEARTEQIGMPASEGLAEGPVA